MDNLESTHGIKEILQLASLIVAGVKRGIILRFVLSLIFGFLSNVVPQPKVLFASNVVTALFVFSLAASLISAGLGAAGVFF